jgi:hypothetical protein
MENGFLLILPSRGFGSLRGIAFPFPVSSELSVSHVLFNFSLPAQYH